MIDRERWTFGSEGTEFEVSDLFRGLVRSLQPDYVLECGTGIGQTAQKIGEALRRNDHGRLDSIEKDPVKCEFARRICQGLPVVIHDSLIKDFKPREKIDITFLDAEPSMIEHDFTHLRSYMKPDSIVVFQGVSADGSYRTLVDLLAQQFLIRPAYLATPNGLAIAQVL